MLYGILAIGLCARYAIFGTEVAAHPDRAQAMCGTELAYGRAARELCGAAHRVPSRRRRMLPYLPTRPLCYPRY
eukprot:3941481-Rhodomonas_salina.2